MTSCLCGSAEDYDSCCGRYHRHQAQPPTAESLMRARYSAFALGHEDFLSETWHSTTRPAGQLLDDELTWTGLVVTDRSGGGLLAATGTVAFTARYRRGDDVGRIAENSRFVREDGRWRYLGPA